MSVTTKKQKILTKIGRLFFHQHLIQMRILKIDEYIVNPKPYRETRLFILMKAKHKD